ncbi:MAG: hypothetical protein HXX11_23690 [Desulfuromonadales bacterium]|nr:hypothetical protein [Desulfuromonadales bacterium]
MKPTLHFVGLMAVILVWAGPLVCAEQTVGKQLSASEIKQTIIGKTTREVNKNGKWFIVFWNEEGTMYGKSGDVGAKGRVSGTWKITEDGHLCSSWNSGRWESGCRTLNLDQKTGEIQKYNMEGSPVAKIEEILPGNPEKLY